MRVSAGGQQYWSMVRGQGTLEFSFVLVLLVFLFYALIQSMRWVVMESVERRFDFEKQMTNRSGVDVQLYPHFHYPRKLDMEFYHP